jgi:hypothetical protein
MLASLVHHLCITHMRNSDDHALSTRQLSVSMQSVVHQYQYVLALAPSHAHTFAVPELSLALYSLRKASAPCQLLFWRNRTCSTRASAHMSSVACCFLGAALASASASRRSESAAFKADGCATRKCLALELERESCALHTQPSLMCKVQSCKHLLGMALHNS